MVILPDKQRICNNSKNDTCYHQGWGQLPQMGRAMDNWTNGQLKLKSYFQSHGEDKICVIGY